MAHETAWTLYKSVENDPRVEKSPERAGQSQAHRIRAIRLYEGLIRRDPSSPRSLAAAKRLHRMRLDVATDYRRYWK